ncbi:hypothetical protein Tco_1019513, partial [Tanacetum coccineum]
VSSGNKHVNSGSVHFNSGTQFKSGASRFNTGKQHVNSGRMYVNSGTPNKSGGSRVNTGKQNVNTARVNRPVLSNQTSQGKMGTAVKTSAGYVWRKTTPHSNTNSGPTPDSYVHVSQGPQGRPNPVKAWVTRINWRILKNSIGDLLPLEVLCTNTTNGYQSTMSNQHKDWLVQVQTALELVIPEQTATGKESSNPFMAGSLPKSIHFCDSLQSDEDSFKLIELMILCTNFLTMVLDLDNTKTSQQSEIASLKRSRPRTHKGRINDIIADEDITLIPKLIIKLLKM